MKATQVLAERQLEVNGRGAFLSRFVAGGLNRSSCYGQELGRFGARGAPGGAVGRSGAIWRWVEVNLLLSLSLGYLQGMVG